MRRDDVIKSELSYVNYSCSGPAALTQCFWFDSSDSSDDEMFNRIMIGYVLRLCLMCGRMICVRLGYGIRFMLF